MFPLGSGARPPGGGRAAGARGQARPQIVASPQPGGPKPPYLGRSAGSVQPRRGDATAGAGAGARGGSAVGGAVFAAPAGQKHIHSACGAAHTPTGRANPSPRPRGRVSEPASGAPPGRLAGLRVVRCLIRLRFNCVCGRSPARGAGSCPQRGPACPPRGPARASRAAHQPPAAMQPRPLPPLLASPASAIICSQRQERVPAGCAPGSSQPHGPG
jgi:hypothetical protein